jgi:DNA repair exonuclease SbcCD ATPase subunit
MGSELAAAQIKLTAAAEDLANCMTHDAAFETERAERNRVLVDELAATTQKDIDNTKVNEAAGASFTTLSEEKVSLTAKRETLSDIKGKALDKKTLLMTDIAKAVTVHGHLLSTVRELNEQIEQIKAKEGDECGLCGVLMDGNAMTTAVTRVSSRVTEVTTESKGYAAAAMASKAKLTTFESLIAPFDVKINDIDAKLREIGTIRTGCSANSISLKANIDRLKKSIQENIERTNSVIIARIAELNLQIALHEAKIEELQSNISGLVFEVEVGKKVEIALGNAGIKSLIFDHVTPELNKFANEALSMLDPEMSVELTTMKKLKTGEYRDKFEVKVETKSGAEVFLGHSGGEKQKVNLAISLAFNKLMRATSDSVPDILVLDEPFEGLDAGTSERVTELLSSFAVDNLFLVTHSQGVKDLCSKSITIEKRDGISTIV